MTQAPATGLALLRQARERSLEWQAAHGGRIVAILGPDVPAELIYAAGHYPLRIGAAIATGAQAGGAYFEPGDSDVVAGLVDLVVGGEMDFVDHLVIGNAPIFNVTLFNFLREARRHSSPPGGPPVSLFELQRGGDRAARRYNQASCQRLLDRMMALDPPPGMPGLEQAVRWGNARRAAIAQLTAQRQAIPSQTGGSAALDVVVRTGLFPMDPVALPPLHPAPGPRILFSGSAQNLAERYRLVEAAGCTIVADDHDWGDHTFVPLIATDGDPLAAIAAAAEAQPPRSTRWPAGIRIPALVERAQAARVDGVVLWIIDEDHAPSWDAHPLVAALAASGIATLDLGVLPLTTADPDAVGSRIAEWLSTLPLGSQREPA